MDTVAMRKCFLLGQRWEDDKFHSTEVTVAYLHADSSLILDTGRGIMYTNYFSHNCEYYL